MTTSYCLSYENLDYSHRDEVAISTDKDYIMGFYNSFVAECREADDYDEVDCISVEIIDEDGEYGDVIAETVFVEPGE